MAFNFTDLKRKRLDDGNKGKEALRGKSEKDDEFVNPFRKARKKIHDEETDTDPVEEEGTDLEELAEGEAGHTAEDKLEGRDADEEEDLDEDEPLPAFLEKEELPDRKKRRRHMAHEKGESKYAKKEEGEDEEPAKREFSLAFRRAL
jgi:hypothetical protein